MPPYPICIFKRLQRFRVFNKDVHLHVSRTNIKTFMSFGNPRVRGKVNKLLGDEQGAVRDLTLAELLEHGTSVCDNELIFSIYPVKFFIFSFYSLTFLINLTLMIC